MKTRIEIETNYQKIISHLKNNQLKEAFDLIGLLLNGENLWTFADKKNELEDTYKTMLRYVVEGAPDPERKKFFNKLKISVLELTDALCERLLVLLADNYEYQEIGRHENKMRDSKQLANEYSVINIDENRTAYEKLIIEIFNRLWLTEKYSEAEYELMKNALSATAISAVMLHLMRIFDEKKIMFLLDVSENDTDEKNRCKAFVAIAFSLYKYDDRLKFYPNIVNRLNLASENPTWRADFVTAMLQIVRTKDTDAITKKLREKILPELQKIQSKIERKLSGDDDFMKNFSEENPEWQKKVKDIVEENKFSEKLMDEFHDMQKSGADVFMSSFAQLKNFSFFGSVCNWFLPFDIKHTELQKGFSTDAERNNINLVMQSGYLCDSDKYSFCFSLSQIPASQKEMLLPMMDADVDSLKEMGKEIKDSVSKKEILFSSCLQNIYRYYKIFGRKLHLPDIFSQSFNFHETYFASQIILSSDELMKFAEYYFANGHYGYALEIFEKIEQNAKDVDAEYYQKIGYCYQNLQNFVLALKNYERADLILPDNRWTLRRLAFCYRFTKQYDRALVCYQRLLSLIPDDLELTLNVGYCQMEMHLYDDAFTSFFKAEYTCPDNMKIIRAVAWCSFLCEKTEQAERYVTKMLALSPNAVDFMNAGHIKLSASKRREAIDFYKQSIKLNPKGAEGFFEEIQSDVSALKTCGKITDEELSLIMEQLKYEIVGN